MFRAKWVLSDMPFKCVLCVPEAKTYFNRNRGRGSSNEHSPHFILFFRRFSRHSLRAFLARYRVEMWSPHVNETPHTKFTANGTVLCFCFASLSSHFIAAVAYWFTFFILYRHLNREQIRSDIGFETCRVDSCDTIRWSFNANMHKAQWTQWTQSDRTCDKS